MNVWLIILLIINIIALLLASIFYIHAVKEMIRTKKILKRLKNKEK